MHRRQSRPNKIAFNDAACTTERDAANKPWWLPAHRSTAGSVLRKKADEPHDAQVVTSSQQLQAPPTALRFVFSRPAALCAAGRASSYHLPSCFMRGRRYFKTPSGQLFSARPMAQEGWTTAWSAAFIGNIFKHHRLSSGQRRRPTLPAFAAFRRDDDQDVEPLLI